MAVTARFLADFASFDSAVKHAEVELKSFEGNANKVGSALNKMADSLQGTKVIQNAQLMSAAVEKIGGVSQLTGTQLQQLGPQAAAAIELMRARAITVPPELQRIADSTKVTTNSWQDFVSGFNVKDAVTNPLGAAKGAAIGFGESMGVMGIAAVAAAGVLAAIGGALFQLAEHAASVGDHLGDMADKTGMSVPALSKLSNAAQVAGTDLGQMTNVVFMLEKKMGEGGEAFEKGLTKMGLSTKELKAAGPDKYLELVIAGLQGIEDPSARAAAGTAVLGKSYRDVAAELMDLGDAMKLTADIEPWTKEQAAEAERFDMQMKSIKIHVEELSIALGRDLIPYVAAFVSGIMDAGSFLNRFVDLSGGLVGLLHTLSSAWETTATAVQMFRGQAEKAPEITGDAASALKRMHEGVNGLALAVPKLSDKMVQETIAEKDLTYSAEVLIDAHKKSAAALAVFAKAQDNVNALIEGTSWDGSIQGLLKLGVSVHDTAVFFGESEGAIERAKSSLETWDKIAGIEAPRSLASFSSELQKLGTAIPQQFFDKMHDLLKAVQDAEQLSHVANFGFRGMADGLAAVGRQVELMPDIAHQFVGPFKEGAQEIARSIREDLMGALKSVPQLMASALTGGGNLMGAVKATGSLIGSTLGEHIGKTFKKLGDLGGPIGAAIGSLAGPAIEGISKLFGKLFGHGVSAEDKAAGNALVKLQQELLNTYGSLDKISEIGKQVGVDLAGAWGDQGQKGLVHFQGLVDQFTKSLDEQKKKAEAMKSALSNAFSGIDKELGGLQKNMEFNLKDIMGGMKGDELKALQDGFKTTKNGAKDLFEFFRQQVKAYRTEQEGSPLLETWFSGDTLNAVKYWTEQTQTYLDHVGLSIATTFQASVRETGSMAEALAQVGPSLDKLIKLQDEFGLKTNESVQFLIDMRKAGTDNADVMDILQGITLQLDGLGGAARLNAELFNGMGEDAVAMYTTLTERGTNADVALALMQPTLQKLWEQQKKFGFVTDEATAKLLTMAEEHGLVGEDMKSVNDQMLDVMKQIRDAITEAVGATKNLGGALSNLPHPDPIHIGIVYDDPGFRTDEHYAARGGLVTSHGIEPQYFGLGGRVLPFRPRGTDTVPAMLTPGERVLSRQQNAAYEAGQRAGSMNTDALESEIRQLRSDIRRLLPKAIRDAIILAG